MAARRDQRRADKVAFRKEQAMAVSEALARSSWRCFYTHTCGEWNLSFRNKCWKCSSKKGQAVEVVLGVPDPVADERSESEGSENDHEEQTADRIAEKLDLTQFLRRRIAYTWAMTRVVRNRLMHILTSNGPSSVVYMLSLALVAPLFWDIHKTSRIIVDEAMTTAAAAASAVIEEAGLGASRAVQVASRGLCPGSGLAFGLLICPLAFGQKASQPPCPYVSWKHNADPARGQRSYL